MSEFFARVKAALAEVYEVEKELGEGGMAIVFLATDRKHGRKVAIKFLTEAVDATSFILMAAKGIRLAFTFDHHVASTGFRLVG